MPPVKPMEYHQLSLIEKDLNRLWSKVVVYPGDNACWGWADVLSTAGYAYLGVGGRKGRKLLARRILYQLTIGPIPEGMDLDHLCRNRWCVRPDHQEPVPRRINLLRGQTVTARNARATHCPQGHRYDIFNTVLYYNRRYCRTCSNIRRRQNHRKAKERAR